MFIVWGTRSKDKELGQSQVSYECERCNNVSRYRIFRRRNWFTIFWIPLIPLSTKYYIACPVCNYGQQIKKAEALDKLQDTV